MALMHTSQNLSSIERAMQIDWKQILLVWGHIVLLIQSCIVIECQQKPIYGLTKKILWGFEKSKSLKHSFCLLFYYFI